MPERFHLNLRYRKRLFRDEEGDMLDSRASLRAHAIAVASDMIRLTRTNIVHDWFACAFEITDERGEMVLVMPFGDAVPDNDDTADS